ncbi:MAG: aminotransferase class V-fold PLP-dependent enzyme [Alphaproteobacteria bacterium]|nr:aminotransferase class V-fold PLP-dependent enzyme [Alphaproteobacteria bacterium]
MSVRRGRHFLHIPGPTNVPDRVLRAMDRTNIDHRGPEFAELGLRVLNGLKPIFKTKGRVVIYPSSGTGCWEAALVNTLSPGDKVLMFEVGQFAVLWCEVARNFGLDVDFVPGDWRHGVDPDVVEGKLAADKGHEIKAVCVVHNETSNGITSPLARIRQAMDAAGHPALLMVDAVSALGSMDFRHDEWGVDVTVASSQKGLMLPAGLGFNAISDKALAAHETAALPRAYWDWGAMLRMNENGFFPYTPATNLFYALDEALKMFEEEGLENVFARHDRLAEATRRAVAAWGLENACLDPDMYSSALTAIMVPDGCDADALRGIILERFDLSLGAGLGKLAGKVFRIGHLGDLNDLTLAGALAGVEMGLGLSDVPHQSGGVDAALRYLAEG